jgi:DNA adenine methylase
MMSDRQAPLPGLEDLAPSPLLVRSSTPPASPVAAALDSYPGGKAGAGVYQTLINQIPPHTVYIEAFLGGGAVMRKKLPAVASIGIDADAAALSRWAGCDHPGLTLIHGDSLAFLSSYPWAGGEFVYCDPPYLLDLRKSGRLMYACEFETPEMHAELLEMLLSLPAMVMLSGYRSQLYSERLRGWRTLTYQAMTRGGRPATEWLWMNYPQPTELHDPRYIGEGFRERERIKKKVHRWRCNLQAMPPLERFAIWTALQEIAAGTASPQASSLEDHRPQRCPRVTPEPVGPSGSPLTAPDGLVDLALPDGGSSCSSPLTAPGGGILSPSAAGGPSRPSR